MKLFFLTQTSSQGAASRARGFILAQFLKKEGWEVKISPGIGKIFYPFVYSHPFFLLKVPFYFIALVKRIFQIPQMRRFDLVVIQKEIFPHFFPLVEMILTRLKIPYIFDFDDALFSRRRKPNWLPKILSHAKGVVAGNDFLAAYASQFQKKVLSLPSLIDVEAFPQEKRPISKNKITLGWVGSLSSWEYLESILPALLKVLSLPSVHLLLIGKLPLFFKRKILKNKKIIFKKWSFSEEIKLLSKIDIGLSPLKEGVWSEGKCAYKTLQYMAAGIPVVASAIGVQKKLIQDGVHGCLVPTESGQALEAWEEKLRRLIEEKGEWEKMGERNRALVAKEYSFQTQTKKFKEFVETLLTSRGSS